MDSGCSKHITGSTNDFLSLKSLQGWNVSFGNGKKGYILGIGRIGKSLSHYLIKNVYYVNGLKHSLLSVSQICDKGNKSGDLTFLSVVDDDAELWHKRLGHASFTLLNKLVKKDLVHGLSKSSFKDHRVCDACVKGKQIRSSFKPKKEVSISRPLDLLNMDLCGPMRVPRRGGKRSKTRKSLAFSAFLSQIEPKNINEALKDADWITSMQEELHQFERNSVWNLVPRPADRIVIGTRLSKFLLENGFTRGKIDNTLFLKKRWRNLLIVQVYVDDIIFRAIVDSLCEEFAKLMGSELEMSMMGELNFFLYLQVKQTPKGTMISQQKYIKKLLKRFDMETSKIIDTPIATSTRLDMDDLVPLPDIVFSVGLCAGFQSNPKESHLKAAKRILRYLKGMHDLVLYYPSGDNFDLIGYTDVDYAGYLSKQVANALHIGQRMRLTFAKSVREPGSLDTGNAPRMPSEVSLELQEHGAKENMMSIAAEGTLVGGYEVVSESQGK
ncbi:uncharacterized protein [Nicotiana tomentosiformis]|uniref:uncharacterized protein n=1 Tax=Nicotiana tomentosiformis TaxID=4098 RepID=UPI00388C5AD4